MAARRFRTALAVTRAARACACAGDDWLARKRREPGFALPVTYPTTVAPAITPQQGVKATIGAELAGKLISEITINQNAILTASCGTTVSTA